MIASVEYFIISVKGVENMIGDNIKKYRRENNISQEELAEKIGVTRQSISLWENNQTQPSIYNIVVIAKVFNLSTDDLLLDLEEQAIETKELQETSETTTSIQNQKRKKSNRTWILCIVASIIAIIGTISTFLIINATDEKRLENAENAVVKIVCYDQLGNIVSTGSGFFYSDAAHLVTNYHVIEDAYKIVCITSDEVSHDVELIYYYSDAMDLAVLVPKNNIDYTSLVYLESSKTEIEKGTQVYAIGSPLGIQNTLSEGIISGRHSTDGINAIQFTASISSGSSGGALLDEKGRVLGITYASYQDGQNLNLAIPIELLDQACPEWNNSMALSVESHYIEKHNYGRDIEFLNKLTSNSIKIVSVEDIKSNPNVYKGKTFAINTYLSSVIKSSKNNESTLYLLSNKDDITGNEENDLTSYWLDGIKKSPFLLARARNNDLVNYGTLKAGENVWAICSLSDDEEYVLTMLIIYNSETNEYASVVPTLVEMLKERQE